jgi:hypothetical protein
MADNEQLKQMDDAAVLAGEELKKHIDQWSAKDLINWWSLWYLKAGHKRLGRLLVKLGKEIKK